MSANRSPLLFDAWLLAAAVLVAIAVRLGVLLLYWSANSAYAWGIG